MDLSEIHAACTNSINNGFSVCSQQPIARRAVRICLNKRLCVCVCVVYAENRSIAFIGSRRFPARRRRWSAACTYSWATPTLRPSLSSGASNWKQRSGFATSLQRIGGRVKFFLVECFHSLDSTDRCGYFVCTTGT